MTQQMIVCLFCETQQPNAWDCSACGRPLHERPTNQPVQVEVVAGLEQTRLEGADVAAVAQAAVEGLEATSIVDSGRIAITAEVVADLQSTALVDSASLGTTEELMPGLQQTRVEDAPADGPTPTAETIACRYCGTPWQPGMSQLCARCGMRLPIPAALRRPAAAATPAKAQVEQDRVTCTTCGARAQLPRTMCGSCGQLVRGSGGA